MHRRHLLIRGAGAAGLATALAASTRGHAVTVVDPDPGRAASRVPWAVVHPVLGLRATLEPRHEEASSARELQLRDVTPWRAPPVRGVLRLPTHERQAHLWKRRAAAWPREVARWVDAEEARRLVPGCVAPWGGIDVLDAVAFPTSPLLEAMAERARVCVRQEDPGASWDSPPREEVVVIEARGHALRGLDAVSELIVPVGGAVATFQTAHPLARVLGWRGSIVPVGEGRVQVSATHAPGVEGREVAEEDVAILRARLVAALPDAADATLVAAWAGTRPATVDHEPVVGRIAAGRWVIGGFGARTWLLASWAAERLIDAIEGDSAALPASWSPMRRPGVPAGQVAISRDGGA